MILPALKPTARSANSTTIDVYLRGDTGAIGPWGTSAYGAVSHTRYEKFKGPGTLEKWQFNGKAYQELGDRGFVSVAFHYNQNRNFFYNNFINLAQFNGTVPYFENDKACALPTGVNGTVQNENTGSTFVRSDGTVGTGSCTNYAGLRINPSDTGNVRVNFSYDLTDNLVLTVDPTFQYVMANGGGFTTISERDDRLDQNNANNAAACAAGANLNGGVDLNGDNDSCDTVAIYTPSNTNTRRYGVLASLIWDMDESNRFRLSYTNDYGRHRQTGEAIDFRVTGDPAEVYAGKEDWGNPALRVLGLDNSFYRSRDRFSLAILNQFAVDYFGEFFDDAMSVSLGVRAPQFKRELNQYCYSQNGSSNVLCTTQTATTTLANGNVQFAGARQPVRCAVLDRVQLRQGSAERIGRLRFRRQQRLRQLLGTDRRAAYGQPLHRFAPRRDNDATDRLQRRGSRVHQEL